jgi:hypothetical protein
MKKLELHEIVEVAYEYLMTGTKLADISAKYGIADATVKKYAEMYTIQHFTKSKIKEQFKPVLISNDDYHRAVAILNEQGIRLDINADVVRYDVEFQSSMN